MASAIAKTLDYLSKCYAGCGIEILSYKRNRFVSIMKLEEDVYRIIENGYVKREIETNLEDMPRHLKTICKVEFPRSRKLRLTKLENFCQIARTRQKI